MPRTQQHHLGNVFVKSFTLVCVPIVSRTRVFIARDARAPGVQELERAFRRSLNGKRRHGPQREQRSKKAAARAMAGEPG